MRKLGEYGEVHDFFDDPIQSLYLNEFTLKHSIDLWMVVYSSSVFIIPLSEVL